jgi:hypothetical protein
MSHAAGYKAFGVAIHQNQLRWTSRETSHKKELEKKPAIIAGCSCANSYKGLRIKFTPKNRWSN